MQRYIECGLLLPAPEPVCVYVRRYQDGLCATYRGGDFIGTVVVTAHASSNWLSNRGPKALMTPDNLFTP
jgi:hypothetical protein